MKHAAWAAVAWHLTMLTAFAQIQSFPHQEFFDTGTVLPAGWQTNGFVISTTASRSAPQCLSATGNNGLRWVMTPSIRFGGRIPDRLTFYERRTTTALRYRLSISAISEDSTYVLPLASWDSSVTANAYTLRTVLLGSASLPAGTAIRFLFRIHPDSTNSTGLLRIDDFMVDARVSLDVLPLNVALDPQPISTGQPLSAQLTIVNRGLDAAGTGLVTAGWTSRNSTGLLPVVRIAIGGQDTLRLDLTIIDLPPGPVDLTFIVKVDEDEVPANDTLAVAIMVGYGRGSLVINEVMYAPVRPDEPEWIELYNPGPWYIALDDVTVSDNSATRVPVSNADSDTVRPGEFIVISRSADLGALYPPFPIVVAAFPSLNNTTPDAVVIRNEDGSTIDSMTYVPATGVETGRTVERRDRDLSSISSRTWRACIDPLGATPGRLNSVQRPEKDVAVGTLEVQRDPADSTRALLSASLFNMGRSSVTQATAIWIRSQGLDGPFEELGASPVLDLMPEDSTHVNFKWNGMPSGPSIVALVVRADGDLDPSNDTAFASTLRSYGRRQVIVNEIMFEPEPGQNEWVELFNPGHEPVEIAGWIIEDLPTTSGSVVRLTLPASVVALPSQSYVLLAADSSLVARYPQLDDGTIPLVVLPRASGFGLNNESDGIVVRDRTGTVIDSVTYARTWHVEGVEPLGRSLERASALSSGVDASSWTSSAAADGATPGRANSVVRRSERNALEVSLSPDPFSPDGDGFEDRLVISYRVDASSLFLHIRIFDLFGREILPLATGSFVPPEGMIEWDGRGASGRVVPIGGYIVLLQATDAINGSSYSAKRVAVVAR